MRNFPSPRSYGFTLVELLVVILIILLVSAVSLPTVLPALSHRQVSESARVLQAALIGAHDMAIRSNAPRGLRFVPDPLLTLPTFANAGVAQPAGTQMLAYNRMIPLETAPYYTEGYVSILPPPWNPTGPYFPPLYPGAGGGYYPSYAPRGHVLMIEEAVYVDGLNAPHPPIPNPPTSWFWNIRIGDKIQINKTGNTYTVVGPMTITPNGDLSNNTNLTNPELFVNVGPPGTTSPLVRTYVDTSAGTNYTLNPEFLFIVNGYDDNKDGFIDNGWDGFDNNYLYGIDDLSEWETEDFRGALGTTLGSGGNPPVNKPYSITRRVVPVQGARETMLPGGVVVDATTWNAGDPSFGWNGVPERSRLPIDPRTLYVDIVVNQQGQIVPNMEYSSPASLVSTTLGNRPFYNFWLSERTDVHETSYLFGSAPAPGATYTNPAGYHFVLPLPLGTVDSTNTTNVYDQVVGPQKYLQGDRRILTIFTQSGLFNVNAIDDFDLSNLNVPY
jgi:prepilin-type N-terminal cleavage/methylation domain-containing protein